MSAQSNVWESIETGLCVNVLYVKDGAVWWESDEVGFHGAQPTEESAFVAAMRPQTSACNLR